MPIAVDLSELPPTVRRQIQRDSTREFGAQARLALIRQQHVAKFYRDHVPAAIDGIGEQTLAIDPWLLGYLQVHHGLSYYGDLDFRTWLAKHHEEFRVKSTGSKIQVGFGSKSSGATRQKFTKRFPEQTTRESKGQRTEVSPDAGVPSGRCPPTSDL